MFVVFEGIDGSGKTTISNRVAKTLRERGLTVEHLREEGAFASKVTQGIRDFCRDARNMALSPRAELMLYVAREVQLADEVLRPALERADVVIADRYLYTAEVLAQAGRDLPSAGDRAGAGHGRGGALAGAGLPDRRRPVGGARAAQGGQDPFAGPSAGVPQGADRQRPSDCACGSATARWPSGTARAGSSWRTATPSWTRSSAPSSTPSRARRIDREAAMLEVRARLAALGSSGSARPASAPPVDGLRSALDAFLGWVDRRARTEPGLAAYVLAGTAGAGVDQRRVALSATAPRESSRAACAGSPTPPPGSCAGSWSNRPPPRSPARSRTWPRKPPRPGPCASSWPTSRRRRWPPASRGSTTRPPGRCAPSSTRASPRRCSPRWRCSTCRARGTFERAGSPNGAAPNAPPGTTCGPAPWPGR